MPKLANAARVWWRRLTVKTPAQMCSALDSYEKQLKDEIGRLSARGLSKLEMESSIDQLKRYLNRIALERVKIEGMIWPIGKMEALDAILEAERQLSDTRKRFQ